MMMYIPFRDAKIGIFIQLGKENQHLITSWHVFFTVLMLLHVCQYVSRYAHIIIIYL